LTLNLDIMIPAFVGTFQGALYVIAII